MLGTPVFSEHTMSVFGPPRADSEEEKGVYVGGPFATAATTLLLASAAIKGSVLPHKERPKAEYGGVAGDAPPPVPLDVTPSVPITATAPSMPQWAPPAAPTRATEGARVDFPKPSDEALRSTTIPRILFMTSDFPKDKLPLKIVNIMEAVTIDNPEFEILYFDAQQRRAFVSEMCQSWPSIIDIYDSLEPTAYQADLWRYLVLYKYGGVYMDVGMQPLRPLRKMLKDSDDFVSVEDDGQGILNSFIATRAKDKVLGMAIINVAESVYNHDYGVNALDITGPLTLKRAFNEVRNVDRRIPLGEYESQGIHYNFLKHMPDREDMENGAYIGDAKGNLLFKRKFDGYYKQMYGDRNIQRYDELYDRRKVYRDMVFRNTAGNIVSS